MKLLAALAAIALIAAPVQAQSQSESQQIKRLTEAARKEPYKVVNSIHHYWKCLAQEGYITTDEAFDNAKMHGAIYGLLPSQMTNLYDRKLVDLIIKNRGGCAVVTEEARKSSSPNRKKTPQEPY